MTCDEVRSFKVGEDVFLCNPSLLPAQMATPFVALANVSSGGPAESIRDRSFFVVHSLNRVQLFVTPWTAALQASLSLTISRSLLKLKSPESVMPSSHLILCHLLLLLPSIFPASGSFPLNRSSHQVVKVLELQLQPQSFR